MRWEIGSQHITISPLLILRMNSIGTVGDSGLRHVVMILPVSAA